MMEDETLPIMRKRKRRPKNKLNIVFDDEARTDFLTGFHKRKLERKKKAKEEFQEKLKEAKKSIKVNARNTYNKIVNSYQQITDEDDLFTKEYDLPNHTVKVCELSTEEIAERNNWIGSNKLVVSEDTASHSNVDASEDNIEGIIPGMAFTSLKQIKNTIKKQSTQMMQQNKIFKMKEKIERAKNRKKAAIEKLIKKRSNKNCKNKKKRK